MAAIKHLQMLEAEHLDLDWLIALVDYFNIGKLGRPWFFQLGLTMWWTPETL